MTASSHPSVSFHVRIIFLKPSQSWNICIKSFKETSLHTNWNLPYFFFNVKPRIICPQADFSVLYNHISCYTICTNQLNCSLDCTWIIPFSHFMFMKAPGQNTSWFTHLQADLLKTHNKFCSFPINPIFNVMLNTYIYVCFFPKVFFWVWYLFQFHTPSEPI